MNIILIGFKNCGKSTVGRLLAEKFHCEFIDTDTILQNSYNAAHKSLLSIPEIFKKEGEEVFRSLESKTINELQVLNNTIVSTGGGSVLKSENIEALKKIGKIIYLKTSSEELIKRQNNTRIPEFLNNIDPIISFMQMYDVRKPIYETAADYIIDVDNKHAPEVVKEIVLFLEKNKQ